MSRIITLSNTGLSRQAIQKQAKKQKITRLFRGAYIDAQEYAALDITGQYKARAEAFLATHPKLEAWGITAAALEGAPILAKAPLHFAGTRSNAKSKQKGCVFHEKLPFVPTINNRTAQILFECATSSPLSDTLLAANYLLRRLSVNASSGLLASRSIDEKTTEALLREPLSSKNDRVQGQGAHLASKLDIHKQDFLKSYDAARTTRFASTQAELVWFDFAQLCVVYGAKRAIRKALRVGLYFSDQVESPAESLLVSRCVELGFEVPYLQVNILDPTSGKNLGRVDGLWPSHAVYKGLYQRDSQFGRLIYSKQFGDNNSVVVEFDGRLKYQQDYIGLLEKERLRQNAIGNLGFRFVRISWEDLMQASSMHAVLTAAKIPKAKYN